MDPADQEAVPSAPAQAPVLIVEDNPDHAFLVMRALRRSETPFASMAVEDGAACIEMLHTLTPAAIVLDYQLPDMDGLTLFARITALAPKTPVIFVTGMGSQQIAVSAMKLGAADYVVKEGEYYNELPRIIALSVEHFQAQAEQESEPPAPVMPARAAATQMLAWEEFISQASDLAAKAAAEAHPLSLLLIGLGDSKDLPAGDEAGLETALDTAVEALVRTVRDEDIVGRQGPRSFAVVAQGAQQAGALRLAERIQAAVAERDATGATPAPPTVSVGIAVLTQAGAGLAELLLQAEEALASAMQEGGNRVRASGARDLAAPLGNEPSAAASAASDETDAGRIGVERQQSLDQLARAFERGEVPGIAIRTQADSCPTCRDAARDNYMPRFAPALPLVGCTNPAGCRCTYQAPGADPSRPPPIPALSAGQLDIPRKLRDAARFGSDLKGGCKAEDLAEYLELFPLLPFDVELELHPGEAAYLSRPARRAWEHPTAASGIIHGPEFPLRGLFLPWVRNIGKPPFLPGDAVPFREEGTLYLTNWRVIFAKRGAVESWVLADFSQIEYLRDGIGCVLGERSHRLVFLVRDPLQVGLCIARAVHDLGRA